MWRLTSNIGSYLRTLAPSFLILIFIAYGMATNNAWFQFGGVFIVLALQMGYQIYKSARASPIINANMQEAIRAKRAKPLLYMTEYDVRTARAGAGSTGEGAQAGKMALLIVVPAAMLFGTTYIIGILWPGVPYWQSFVVGFLISMPASAILASKTGLPQGGQMVTPASYIVTERGIAYDQMGRSFILRFPLKRVALGKSGNSVEVEGFSEAPIVPNRLRLYTEKTDELLRLLSTKLRKDNE